MEVTYVNHMGDDLSVVNAARVSFHKMSEGVYVNDGHWASGDAPYPTEADKKLINYLAKHKHFSPFNHAFLSFRIKAPIFVARQLVKHKFMPWNEVSRRYVDDEPEFYWPDQWRGRPMNSKQGSDGVSDYMDKVQWNGKEYGNTESSTNDIVLGHISDCINWYNDMIKNGVAPEQARMILPQNMHTEWIWSGTLGAYADMLRLRLDPHTQAESREVAQMIYKEVEKLFPVSIKALLERK